MHRHIFDGVGRVSSTQLTELPVIRWTPPTIGEGGHLIQAEPREESNRQAVEEPPVDEAGAAIPAAELEQLRAQARQQGYEEGLRAGHDAGLEAGRNEGLQHGFEQGLEKGLQEGRQQAREELNAQLAELNEVLTHLTHSLNDQDYQLEQALLKLVEEVSRQVVLRELKISSAHIMEIVRQAMAVLPPSRDNLRIFVNPADLPLLEQAAAQGGENWRALASQEVSRGGCRIETDQSVVDFTTEHRFQRMIEQLVTRQLSSIAPDGEAGEESQESDAFEAAPQPVLRPMREAVDDGKEDPEPPLREQAEVLLTGQAAALPTEQETQ